MKLSQLGIGQVGSISEITDESYASRLFELGLFPGAEFRIIRKAPFRGPIYLQVDESLIAIRKVEADIIQVV